MVVDRTARSCIVARDDQPIGVSIDSGIGIAHGNYIPPTVDDAASAARWRYASSDSNGCPALSVIVRATERQQQHAFAWRSMKPLKLSVKLGDDLAPENLAARPIKDGDLLARFMTRSHAGLAKGPEIR